MNSGVLAFVGAAAAVAGTVVAVHYIQKRDLRVKTSINTRIRNLLPFLA